MTSYGKYSKHLKTLSPFSNKILAIRDGIHKILDKIANDQTAFLKRTMVSQYKSNLPYAKVARWNHKDDQQTKDFVEHYKLPVITCPDPENFVREGRTLTVFLVDERIQIPLKAGHHWPASETQLKWRFAGGPMMPQH